MTPKHRLVLGKIIGWVAIVAVGVWCFYNWVFVEGGPAYFAADPRRILWVVVISLIGGAVVFLFMNLALATRRRFAVVLFGTMAVLAGVACLQSLWALASLSRQYPEVQLLLYLRAVHAGLCLVLCGVCILLGRHFRRSA